jgi:transposase
MTPEQAAKQLGVNGRTAYNWVKKDQKNPSDTLEPSNGKTGVVLRLWLDLRS